jgi:hypothetical protein
MGDIRKVNVPSFVENYNITSALETGTLHGSGANYLASLVEVVCTVELVESVYLGNIGKLAPNVVPFKGSSIEKIPVMLDKIKQHKACILWLDAHLPNLHHGVTRPEFSIDFPLETELRLILSNRDCSNDVFIIDDLRIYMDGLFEHGNWIDRPRSETVDGIYFIEELFNSTHDIELSFRHEGYIFLTPRTKK